MSGLQAIGALIVRFWGAWAVFYSLGGLAALFANRLESEGDRIYFIWALVQSDAGIALGLAAWFFAPRLAKRFIPATATADPAESFRISDLVAAGGFLIGVYYLITYLPRLAGRIVMVFNDIAESASYGPVRIDHHDLYFLVVDVVAIGLALFLALRPKEIAKLFSGIRNAGLSPTE